MVANKLSLEDIGFDGYPLQPEFYYSLTHDAFVVWSLRRDRPQYRELHARRSSDSSYSQVELPAGDAFFGRLLVTKEGFGYAFVERGGARDARDLVKVDLRQRKVEVCPPPLKADGAARAWISHLYGDAPGENELLVAIASHPPAGPDGYRVTQEVAVLATDTGVARVVAATLEGWFF